MDLNKHFSKNNAQMANKLNTSTYQGNADPNHREVPFHTHHGSTAKKRQIIASVGDTVEKMEIYTLCVGVQNGAAARKSSLTGLRKLNLELPRDPVSPLLNLFPRNKNKCPQNLYKHS